MSSSEPSATRRAALGLALAAVLPPLAGCGLRPIHGSALGRAVNPRLAAVEVGELDGRLGYVFRDYLIEELNPAGLSVPSAYALEIGLQRELNALAIQLDDTITRYNLIVAVRFALRRKADGRTLYESALRRVASYNVRREPFATLVAEQDAERRAAREAARGIRTRLALYFADQAA